MRFTFALMSLLLPVLVAPAQETAGAQSVGVYRLNIAFREMDDSRPVGTKTYTMLLKDGSKGVIKVGNKVPVQTSGGNAVQFTYVDVGMNLDCRLTEVNGRVNLHLDTEASNVSTDGGARSTGQPTIRQIRSVADAVIVPGKPAVVTTLDDPATKRHYEIEVTATKVP